MFPKDFCSVLLFLRLIIWVVSVHKWPKCSGGLTEPSYIFPKASWDKPHCCSCFKCIDKLNRDYVSQRFTAGICFTFYVSSSAVISLVDFAQILILAWKKSICVTQDLPDKVFMCLGVVFVNKSSVNYPWNVCYSSYKILSTWMTLYLHQFAVVFPFGS